MKPIVQHAQGLVYSLLCLMPNVYQKANLNARLGLFLETQGYPLPEHTPFSIRDLRSPRLCGSNDSNQSESRAKSLLNMDFISPSNLCLDELIESAARSELSYFFQKNLHGFYHHLWLIQPNKVTAILGWKLDAICRKFQ